MLMQKELDIFKIYEWQFLSQMLNHYALDRQSDFRDCKSVKLLAYNIRFKYAYMY